MQSLFLIIVGAGEARATALRAKVTIKGNFIIDVDFLVLLKKWEYF